MIEIRDLVKEYPTEGEAVRALRGLTLTIADEEFVSIAGPTGSGKSTLLNLIGCLDTATSGEIRLNQKLVSGMTKREWASIRRESLGFVFQSYNLIPVLTALENVALALELLGLSHDQV